MTTVDALLADARASGVDRLDAQLLLGRMIDRPRAWLMAHGEAPVAAADAAGFRTQCAMRASGTPLAYLTGEREFHGLMLRVTPDILVPRPETELLVDWALDLLEGPMASTTAPAVVDLGTGSGAIALAIKKACPRARVVGVDISEAAVVVARANADQNCLNVAFEQSNWFDGLAGRQFDLILSNPPYIDGNDPHLTALRAEPLRALSPGEDGLAALRQIADGALRHLAVGAWLLLEHGHLQGAAVCSMLRAASLSAVETRPDLAGLPRCTGGRRIVM